MGYMYIHVHSPKPQTLSMYLLELRLGVCVHMCHAAVKAYPSQTSASVGISTLLCAELFLNANLDSASVGSRPPLALSLGSLEMYIHVGFRLWSVNLGFEVQL